MTNPMCAELANNRLPNIPECPGIQSDVRRNPPVWHWTIWSAPILVNLSSFLPHSNPCSATLKPRKSQSSWSKCHSIFQRSTGNFTEVEKKHPTSRSPTFLGPSITRFLERCDDTPFIFTSHLQSLRRTPCLRLIRQSVLIVKIWTQRCGRSHQRQWLFTKPWSLMQHRSLWVKLTQRMEDDGVYHHGQLRRPRGPQDQEGVIKVDWRWMLVLAEHPRPKVNVICKCIWATEVAQHPPPTTLVSLGDALPRSPRGSKVTRSR